MQTLWTSADESELRRIYALSSWGASAAAMRRFCAARGIATWKARQHAARLGIARASGRHRPWTESDLQALRRYAGRMPLRRIAHLLARSEYAVRLQLRATSQYAAAARDGYTCAELAELMGLDLKTGLRTLLSLFPLQATGRGRYSQSDISLWIWEHMDAMEWRRCDQTWLKAMLRR